VNVFVILRCVTFLRPRGCHTTTAFGFEAIIGKNLIIITKSS